MSRTDSHLVRLQKCYVSIIASLSLRTFTYRPASRSVSKVTHILSYRRNIVKLLSNTYTFETYVVHCCKYIEKRKRRCFFVSKLNQQVCEGKKVNHKKDWSPKPSPTTLSNTLLLEHVVSLVHNLQTLRKRRYRWTRPVPAGRNSSRPSSATHKLYWENLYCWGQNLVDAGGKNAANVSDNLKVLTDWNHWYHVNVVMWTVWFSINKHSGTGTWRDLHYH